MTKVIVNDETHHKMMLRMREGAVAAANLSATLESGELGKGYRECYALYEFLHETIGVLGIESDACLRYPSEPIDKECLDISVKMEPTQEENEAAI